jgi:hypothetical protein
MEITIFPRGPGIVRSSWDMDGKAAKREAAVDVAPAIWRIIERFSRVKVAGRDSLDKATASSGSRAPVDAGGNILLFQRADAGSNNRKNVDTRLTRQLYGSTSPVGEGFVHMLNRAMSSSSCFVPVECSPSPRDTHLELPCEICILTFLFCLVHPCASGTKSPVGR